MWIQVPDSQPMGGPIMGSVDNSAVVMAKSILKEYKANRKKTKEEDAKKAAKNKPQTFTLLESSGMILLFSIPVTLCQLWALEYVQKALNAALHGSPN